MLADVGAVGARYQAVQLYSPSEERFSATEAVRTRLIA
jgi:hypothetical protein